MALASTSELLLVTGEVLELDGPPDEVAKALENAARSSAGTLAWLKETSREQMLGVNPAQVVTVRPAER
jgi:hypothetical protein